jgi:hypothetical protein
VTPLIHGILTFRQAASPSMNTCSRIELVDVVEGTHDVHHSVPPIRLVVRKATQ